tara:strand:+ start:2397 stop:3611 length:1215 start_codon:yes stop_codon:yes gene_type:complete
MLKSTPGALFMVYLSLLSMLGFLSTDMYLPAFYQIEQTFHASAQMTSLSLSIFIAGLTLGQLLYGKLVYYKGNRNSLLIGLTVFLLSTFSICWVEQSSLFIICRFFQGVGASSASVIWQSIVMERYDDQQSKKIFATIMPLVALSPALAPLLGTYILQVNHWHYIFITLGGVAAFLFLSTLQLAKVTPSLSQQEQKQSYKAWNMLTHPVYMNYVFIFSGCSALFFAYLTGWPQIMKTFGFSENEIGLSFIPQTIMFILGGSLNKFLSERINSDKLLWSLLSLIFVSFTIMLTLYFWVQPYSLFFLMVPFCFIALANGAIYPLVVYRALRVFPHNTAQAAGLQNFLQLSICTLSSCLVSYYALSPLIAVLGVMSLFALFVGVNMFCHVKMNKLNSVMESQTKQLI